MAIPSRFGQSIDDRSWITQKALYMNSKNGKLVEDASTPDDININGNTYFDIDELIVPLIRICNKKDYTTQFCCSGHGNVDGLLHDGKIIPKNWVDEPYILFTDKYDFKDLPNGWFVDEEDLYDEDTGKMRTCIRYHSHNKGSSDAEYLNRYRGIIDAIESLCRYFGDLPKNNGMVQESTMTSKQRNKLDDSDFGIPELRKYPLTDKDHVIQAVRFFNKAPDKYKEELANNIVKRAKELNVDWEKWDTIKPYLDKSINESSVDENISHSCTIVIEYIADGDDDDADYEDSDPDDCYCEYKTSLTDVKVSDMDQLYFWSPTRIDEDVFDGYMSIENNRRRLFVTDKIGLCPFYTLYDSYIFKKIRRKHKADIEPILPRDIDDLPSKMNINIKLISPEAKAKSGSFTLYVYGVDKTSISIIKRDRKYKSEYLYLIPKQNGGIRISEKPIKTSHINYFITPDISIKEGYKMSIPDRFRTNIFTESDEPDTISVATSVNAPDESETTHPEDDTSLDINVDISSLGSDTGDVNNDYDPKELELIQNLITDEMRAMGMYFDAAKNTNVDVLRRLYSDIGGEEKFHSEQLLFAKAQLTGETYTPADPDVKAEYDELLSMGMDEETAAVTAFDKLALKKDVDDNDGDVDTAVSDIEDLSNDLTTLEACVNHIQLVSAIYESGEYDINNPIIQSAEEFIQESFIFQESINNAAMQDNSKSANNNQGQTKPHPIRSIANLIWKLYTGLLNLIRQLKRKFKDFISKNKILRKKRNEFIKEHGIKGIFAPGVSMYMWNGKTNTWDYNECEKYLDLLSCLTIDIKNDLFKDVPHENIAKPNRPGQIKYNNIAEGINILRNIVLTKTKIIVTDENQTALAEKFFGYTTDKNVNGVSNNMYNSMDLVLEKFNESFEALGGVVKAVSDLEGKQNSIYYTNRLAYEKGMKNLQAVLNGYQPFIKALNHDMQVMFKLNSKDIFENMKKNDQQDSDAVKQQQRSQNPQQPHGN